MAVTAFALATLGLSVGVGDPRLTPALGRAGSDTGNDTFGFATFGCAQPASASAIAGISANHSFFTGL